MPVGASSSSPQRVLLYNPGPGDVVLSLNKPVSSAPATLRRGSKAWPTVKIKANSTFDVAVFFKVTLEEAERIVDTSPDVQRYTQRFPPLIQVVVPTVMTTPVKLVARPVEVRVEAPLPSLIDIPALSAEATSVARQPPKEMEQDDEDDDSVASMRWSKGRLLHEARAQGLEVDDETTKRDLVRRLRAHNEERTQRA